MLHAQQVKFYFNKGEHWPVEPNYTTGFRLAHNNLIICACCGRIMRVFDIELAAKEDNKVGVIPLGEWVDVSFEVNGKYDG